MKRTKSSNAWLQEHVHDHWVQMAKKDGYRARAAYKLLEINEKDKLIRPGTVLADLGSTPGSWSQVAAHIAGPSGRVFAIDILPMDPVPGVEFIEGDFREQVVLDRFVELLGGRELDLVISDMAPNISGMSAVDQARSFHLTELALDFAREHLKPGGNFLVKVFQGSEFQSYLKAMRELFAEVATRKPKASRDRSSEIYLLGKGRR
jgi:23S rRNA (uridine2552-2'-O)-methyltransferase